MDNVYKVAFLFLESSSVNFRILWLSLTLRDSEMGRRAPSNGQRHLEAGQADSRFEYMHHCLIALDAHPIDVPVHGVGLRRSDITFEVLDVDAELR